VTLGVVRVMGDDENTTPAAGEPTPTGTPSETGTTPTEETSPPAATFTVAAYFVGETGRGHRLFREFLPATGNDVAHAAVNVAMRGGIDKDYEAPWDSTGAEASSVTGDADLVTIDLDGDVSRFHDRPAGMDEATASLAIEQLMRTAQGALKVGRAPVQFLVNGKHVDTLLGEPVSEPLANQQDGDVLANVWVNTPSDGADVSAGDEVEGLANSFEANVTWQLKQGDTVVEEGFTTAEECCKLAPYSFQLPDVPPGTYTLVVSEDDPSGGAEGAGPDFDTKDITYD